jgi:hypothetical protein
MATAEVSEAQVTTDKPAKKSRGLMKPLLVSCLVIFLCICCCITVFASVLFVSFGAAVSVFQDEVTDKLCNASTIDLERSYNEDTTEHFRNTTTLFEYRSMVSVLQDEVCDEFEGLNIFNLAIEGWDINYNNDSEAAESLELKGEVNDRNVEIRMKNEDGELKIDFLEVK